MKVRNMLALTLSAALAAGVVSQVVVGAPKAATSKPADDTKGVHLTAPFSKMTDLTPEETTKLKEIHKKFLEDEKKLKAQEMDDSMAVLTDAQKAEAAALEKPSHPTTKPSKE